MGKQWHYAGFVRKREGENASIGTTLNAIQSSWRGS